MISMTELERMLFRCPEVNISKYPQASYEEFLLMDHDFSGEYVCVYPFVKMDESGTPETSCQGLFNQIHKKATKKCQKHFHAPDTQAGGLLAAA